MAKFRETNWFKRGELVIEGEIETTEGKVELPIEDRYLDQGTTSNADSVMYGVHTGETARIPSVKILFDNASDTAADPAFASAVIACDPSSARELQHMIQELKQRNRTIVAMCGAAVVALVAFAVVIV